MATKKTIRTLNKNIARLVVIASLVAAFSAPVLSAQSQAEGAGRGPGRLATYREKACGVKFRYPKNWKVTMPPTDQEPDRDKVECQILIRPPNFSQLMRELDVDLYSVKVEVFKADFKAAAERGFFKQKENGNWVALGMFELEGDAQKFKDRGVEGLTATVTERCYHESDGYWGLCEPWLAVLNDGRNHAATFRAGDDVPPDEFHVIFNSFKFFPPSRAYTSR